MQIAQDEHRSGHRHENPQAPGQVPEKLPALPSPLAEKEHRDNRPREEQECRRRGDMRPVGIAPTIGGWGNSHSSRESTGIPRSSTSSISPYAERSADITAASMPTGPCEGPIV